MRRWAQVPGGWTLVALACLLPSCGSESPTSPALDADQAGGWPDGTVVTVVSGETGEPVVGARATLAGTPYTTNPAGGFALLTGVDEGAEVEVEATGFLHRETVVRHDDTRLTMWPDHSGLPGEYTKTLVYTASTVHDRTSLVPLERLPPHVGTLALVPSASLAADPVVLAAHQHAADFFNAAVEGRTVFSVGQVADMTVPTRLDAGDDSCEGRPGRLLARTWVSAHEVTRAEIVFCGEAPTRLPGAIAHELGHIFGLAHSRNTRDVMYLYYHPAHERGFSDREALTMNLLYLRRGGNAWPDNDRGATMHATLVREFVD